MFINAKKILSNKFLKNVTDFSVSIQVLYQLFDLLSTTIFVVVDHFVDWSGVGESNSSL